MSVTCLVVGCGSCSNRDQISFYSVPAVLNHRCLTHLNDLSTRRRGRWLAALKRDDLTKSMLRNQRVCSRYFITGKPSSLDENYSDWVPSQNMEHTSLNHWQLESGDDREQRAKKRLSARSLERQQASTVCRIKNTNNKPLVSQLRQA